MTDEDLAGRAQLGDSDAFVALVHRYHLPLYRLAYRFAGSAEGAEDLCQEILVRAFRQLSKYDRRRPFLPWIMRVATNVSLNSNEGSRHRRELEIQMPDQLELPANDDTEREVMETMDRKEVLEALGNLPKDCRLLLIMRFSLGLTFREIAEQTGFKLPTVAFRIGKGVEALRKVLAPGFEVNER